MALVKKIESSNEKKLVITEYLPKTIIEPGQEEYITIRKLPRSVKRKIQILTYETIKGDTRKKIMDKMSQKGKTIEELQALKEENSLEFLRDLDLEDEELDKMNFMSGSIEELLINNGVHPTKHSFIDEKNQPIEIDYSFFEELLNDEVLVMHIINEIKSFSRGYGLGK